VTRPKTIKEHICVVCKALPEAEQPKTVRPTDIEKHPRTPHCATHRRERKKADKQKSHDRRVQKTYDLPPGEYERLYIAQGGKCWFPRCNAKGTGKRKLAVDHDHVTGRVRGLVCMPHNYYLLGMFAQDLDDAKAYINDPPYQRWLEGRDLWAPDFSGRLAS
jgi:hypothetical protein